MKAIVTGEPVSRRALLEKQALVLAKYCPVDSGNPLICPLCELRKLGARARRAWVRRLTRSDLEFLTLYHATCSAERRRDAAGSC
ncbi:MAG: hypothetical protein PSU94_16295 [Lacunisphaera sp.]|nr:hypothetical protein [Lacunisphaera sp.]